MTTPPANTRRRLLCVSASAVLWAAAQPARAQTQPDELAAAVAAYAGGAVTQEGKVSIDIAKLVDNGNAVPITVTVDSPMTASSHVARLAVFTERNPQREVFKATLGPRAGTPAVATRIRLATSQKITAVAQLSDGSFWTHTVSVIVTLAACIEGES
jgi:sulfur-oxidizing protein SoxY